MNLEIVDELQENNNKIIWGVIAKYDIVKIEKNDKLLLKHRMVKLKENYFPQKKNVLIILSPTKRL